MTGCVVSLPYPISANRLWRFVPGQQTPLKSAAYRKWLSSARAECIGVRRLKGPFRITILATRPDNRARDLDNLAKPVLDALKGIAFEDDKDCQSLLISWSASAPVKGGAILATVEPVFSEPVLASLERPEAA